jgi:shikimate kinase
MDGSSTEWRRNVSTRLTSGGVALGGFMGVGKSTVGALLAGELGLPFVDMDRELEAAYGPICDQFKSVGEGVFRERESTLFVYFIERKPAVVATGGGVWERSANRRRLESHWCCVVLHARWETLLSRVKEGPERPLWTDSVHALFLARQQGYQWGDHHVEVNQRTPSEVSEEIATWLRPFA